MSHTPTWSSFPLELACLLWWASSHRAWSLTIGPSHPLTLLSACFAQEWISLPTAASSCKLCTGCAKEWRDRPWYITGFTIWRNHFWLVQLCPHSDGAGRRYLRRGCFSKTYGPPFKIYFVQWLAGNAAKIGVGCPSNSFAFRKAVTEYAGGVADWL